MTSREPHRKTFELRGWPGGLVDSAWEPNPNPEQLRVAVNVKVTESGSLVMTNGELAIEPNASHEHPYYWVYAWKPGEVSDWTFVLMTGQNPHGTSGGRRWYEWATSPDLSSYYSGTWGTGDPDTWDPSSGQYGYWPQPIVMDDALYLTRAGANPTIYKLTAPSGTPTVAELTPWYITGDTTTKYPAAVAMCVAHERVFAAGVQESSTSGDRKGDRLYFSDALAPTTWKTANYIDVAPDENTHITKLVYFNGMIVIFKENSIYGLAGSDFSGLGNVQLFPIDTAIGTTVPASVVDAGGRLLFLSLDRGVMEFDGSRLTPVSDAVFGELKDQLGSISAENLLKCNAWLHDGAYNLHVRQGYGTWRYDLGRRIWTRTQPTPDAVTTYTEGGASIAVTTSDGLDGLFSLSDGFESASGSPLSLQVAVPHLAPEPGLLHRLHSVELEVAGGDERTVRVAIYGYVADGEIIMSETYDSTLSDSYWLQWLRFSLPPKRVSRFSIFIQSPVPGDDTVYDSPLEIRAVRVTYSTLPSRRGAAQ